MGADNSWFLVLVYTYPSTYKVFEYLYSSALQDRYLR